MRLRIRGLHLSRLWFCLDTSGRQLWALYQVLIRSWSTLIRVTLVAGVGAVGFRCGRQWATTWKQIVIWIGRRWVYIRMRRFKRVQIRLRKRVSKFLYKILPLILNKELVRILILIIRVPRGHFRCLFREAHGRRSLAFPRLSNEISTECVYILSVDSFFKWILRRNTIFGQIKVKGS